ncbi:hypothetical protein PHYPSEUDO_012708 [Phytophthora pseudosyringae]|uniref:Succinate dehydrogenase assembly factor 4, mitochondrial n=1 Tax=Phytophthora pseudosyringae TaxID=221518 RepID=A0A8T1W822_9STRA|nr:hypothetical protein PHYPSEUDO_012708 [Phytophthora pseudosyringae]
MALRRVLRLAAAGSRRSLVSKQPSVTQSRALMQQRFISSAPQDADFVALHPSGKPHITNSPAVPVSDDLDDDEEEETVAIGPSGVEYGGPTRGGKLKEPTRFGDWERKGRCSDF